MGHSKKYVIFAVKLTNLNGNLLILIGLYKGRKLLKVIKNLKNIYV